MRYPSPIAAPGRRDPASQPEMTGPLYALGRLCVRRRFVVLGVWLAIFAGLIAWAAALGPETNDNLTLPGTDSQRATDLLEERFPAQANGTNPVVVAAPAGHRLSESRYSSAISSATSAFGRDPAVRQAINPLSSAGSDDLSKDGRIGFISLNLYPSPSELSNDEAAQLASDDHGLSDAGLQVAFGGYLGQKISKPATELSEVVGLCAAIIVLLLTFGTAVAMGVPIATAIVGLVSGLSVITLLGHVVQLPTTAPTLATMIGLGVGIDYALFIVTRHRDQVREGMSYPESVARAVATSGGAVVFAGCTVIIALLALIIVDVPLVTTLGYSSAIVVAIAVLAAITFLPTILALLGPRLERLRIPLPHGRGDGKPHGWARWARIVAARPVVFLLVALVALAVMAFPVRDLYLGQQDNGSLPTDTQARQSYDLLSEGFGPGENGQFLIAADLSKQPAKANQTQIDQLNQQEQAQLAQAQTPEQQQQITQSFDAKKKQASSPATDPRLQDLRTDMQKTGGVEDVSQPLVNGDGTAAVYNVTPTTAPSDRKTQDTVNTLRDDTIPKAVKGQDEEVYVGGSTAGYIDLATEINDRLVITIGAVVLLSFLLLVAAFRSLIVPATAAIMNLISIAAAFGVVTAVFEKGFGLSLVGLEDTVPIVSFVPLMMFAILFGLSMDYEVFLVTHMREAWRERHDNHHAVVQGLATTGRVITSAALIMVSVFLAFVLNGDPTVKQFGVGMAVAVAVDATLVRCLLVPAVMTLIGKANWWFPRWMERTLPDLSIEGEEYFAERDAAATGATAGAAPQGEPAR